jgi:hypothetical protein
MTVGFVLQRSRARLCGVAAILRSSLWGGTSPLGTKLRVAFSIEGLLPRLLRRLPTANVKAERHARTAMGCVAVAIEDLPTLCVDHSQDELVVRLTVGGLSARGRDGSPRPVPRGLALWAERGHGRPEAPAGAKPSASRLRESAGTQGTSSPLRARVSERESPSHSQTTVGPRTFPARDVLPYPIWAIP